MPPLLFSSFLLLFLAPYFNLFFSPSHTASLAILSPIMNCIQYVVLQLRGLHFHIDGFFGELENWMLLSIFLVMADAEVEENCTQWPNRSLPSKALQMHLSELNSYELCTQVRDNSAVTEAGNEDELKRGVGDWTGRVIHRCGRIETNTQKRLHKKKKKAVKHTPHTLIH